MTRKFLSSPFLYLLILGVYCLGLSGMSVPLTGDQKVYLSIALEMRERGEWIIPYLFNVANFLKPPFQYWATLIGWKIFGFNLFGALLPSVLALVASAYLVNKISAERENLSATSPMDGSAEKKYLPGLLFAASLGTMTYGTTAQMEIWIVCFYLWAWRALLQKKYLQTFLIVGVMAWIKGPLYPVLFVLSNFLWFWLSQQRKEILTKKFILSLILGAGVGLAWYFLAAQTHREEMMNVFFRKENMGKMQTNQGTGWSLWGEFLYSLFPWLFLFLIGITQSAVQNHLRKEWRFYVAFAAIPALFFTFFPYHVNTYLYLLTPLFAWITAQMSEEEPSSIAEKSILWLLTAVGIFLCFLAYRLERGGWIGFELAGPLVLSLMLWMFFSWDRNLAFVALLSLMIVNLIRVGAVEIGEKDLAGLRLYHQVEAKPLAYWIDDKDIWHEYGLVSAALQTPVQRLYADNEISDFLAKGGALLLQDRQIEEHPSLLQNMNCVPWLRLKKRMKFPLVKLLQEGLEYGNPQIMRVYSICSLVTKSD